MESKKSSLTQRIWLILAIIFTIVNSNEPTGIPSSATSTTTITSSAAPANIDLCKKGNPCKAGGSISVTGIGTQVHDYYMKHCVKPAGIFRRWRYETCCIYGPPQPPIPVPAGTTIQQYVKTVCIPKCTCPP